MLEKIKKFLSESRQELRHVNWPTRQEATRLTGIVIFISLGLAVFLGSFDFVFTDIVKNIVTYNVSGGIGSPIDFLDEGTVEDAGVSADDIEISTENGDTPNSKNGEATIDVEPLNVQGAVGAHQ